MSYRDSHPSSWCNAKMRRFWMLFGPLLACQPVVLDVGGGSLGENCDVQDELSCAPELACLPVDGDGDMQCVAPFEIHGRVIDGLARVPIPGARVAALDEAGVPISDVATSDAQGDYILQILVERDETGQIAAGRLWTLFAAAPDYLSFPGGLRPALPVDSSGLMGDPGHVQVLENATTTIALFPRVTGGSVIQGVVGNGEEGAGALVVAEGATPSEYGLADRSGAYVIFNVPAGEVTVRAYKAGTVFREVSGRAGDGDLRIDLPRAEGEDASLAEVNGAVEIVDSPGGAATSVVLIPASVYVDALERGPVPLGLRAPDPGVAPDVSGSFSIRGVPPGRYKVLAGFENDGLVRDPDETIAGTQVQEVEVVPGQSVAVPEMFKVTAALDVVGPGRDGLEEVEVPVTLIWTDDSSETHYELVVLDALGAVIWEQLMIASGNEADVAVPYEGPPLQPGMIYQFRATSVRETPQAVTALSRTEDLRGLFTLAP